eukprot:gene41373-26298_t
MGTTDYTPLPDKTHPQPSLEFNQRIGVAWSKSPYGPWTRLGEPIISPGPLG